MSESKNVLEGVVAYVDGVFGAGYAKGHPALVGAVFHGNAVLDAAESLAEPLKEAAGALRDIAANMVTPEMGAALHGLSELSWLGSLDGLREIADAVDPNGQRHWREEKAEAEPNGRPKA